MHKPIYNEIGWHFGTFIGGHRKKLILILQEIKPTSKLKQLCYQPCVERFQTMAKLKLCGIVLTQQGRLSVMVVAQ